MRFGLFGLHKGPGIDPTVLAHRARNAEEAGFESLWVGDHLALPSVMPGAEEPRLEALATLLYLAAATSTIRLAAGVIVVSQREPVLLAKQLTSLDVLSGGRLIFGVGVGHLEPELAALGVPMTERGRRADAALVRILELWESARRQPASGDVVQFPPPVQQPHPPIVVGGDSDAALARTARLAAGWFGWLTSVEATSQVIGRLDEIVAKGERPEALGPIEITVASPGTVTPDVVDAYAAIGVSRLVVGPDSSDGDEPDRFLEEFHRSVLSHP